MKSALYVGSFDPITLGHLDIIDQASRVFDHLHVEIGINPRKSPSFSVRDRAQMIEDSLAECRQRSVPGDHRCSIDVGCYEGSVMARARQLGVGAIVRGLRQISDFGDEFTLNGLVARSLPDVPMTYFICRQDFLHVSSSSVKELARLGEDVSWMVTRAVRDRIAVEFEY